jgi:hypothetical protein
MMTIRLKTAALLGTAFLCGSVLASPANAQDPSDEFAPGAGTIRDVNFRDGIEFFDFGDIRVQMVRDTKMHVPLMRLEAFPDKHRMIRINQFLEGVHRQEIARVKECLANLPPKGPYRNDDNPMPMDVSISYVTEKAMSYTVSSAWYCGGNRPNVEIRPVILDLENLSALDPEPCAKDDISCAAQTGRLGRLIDLSTNEKRKAFNMMWWSEWKANAELLVTLTEEAEPLAEECTARSQPDPEVALHEAGFALDRRGLIVTRLDHPAPATHCMDQPFNSVVIPWNVVRPYLVPGQTLLTAADLAR